MTPALQAHNVLVTGAGGGLGRAIAEAVAAAGAQTLLLGRRQGSLEDVHDAIVAAGGLPPILIPTDLARLDADQARQIGDAVLDQCGELHGLVHNAAVAGPRVPLRYHSDADWREALDVNLTAPFLLTRALLPALEASRGSVVLFVSDSVGRAPGAYWGAYAVSKAALEALAQVLADELAATSRVRVNVVDPGPTRTQLRARQFPGDDVFAVATAAERATAFVSLLATVTSSAATTAPAHGDRIALAAWSALQGRS